MSRAESTSSIAKSTSSPAALSFSATSAFSPAGTDAPLVIDVSGSTSTAAPPSSFFDTDGDADDVARDDQKFSASDDEATSAIANAAAASDRYTTPTQKTSAAKWHRATWLCMAAIGLDAFYQYFLGDAVKNSISESAKGLAEEWGGNPQSNWLDILTTALGWICVGTTVVGNAIGDLTAATPVQDSHDVITNPEELLKLIAKLRIPNNHPQITTALESNSNLLEDETALTALKMKIVENEFNRFQKESPKWFLYFNRLLIIPFNYVVLSGADGIAMADMSGNSKGATVSLTVIAGLLGSIYYHLLTDGKLVNTAVQFMTRVFSTKREDFMTLMVLQHPLLAAQAFFEIFSNAFYRGVASGYMSYQLTEIFAQMYTSSPYTGGALSSIVGIPALATAYTTIASRSMPALTKAFSYSSDHRAQTQFNLTQLSIPNVFFALNRAFFAAYLVFSTGNDSNAKTIRSVEAAITGLLTLLHALYAEVQIARNKESLALKAAQDEKDASSPSAKPKVEKALSQWTSTELFLEIGKGLDKALKNKITAVNILSRTARQIAFIKFLTSLCNSFLKDDMQIDLGLKPSSIIAIGQIFGMEIFKNDYDFYGPNYEAGWIYYATLMIIYQYTKQIGFADSANSASVASLGDGNGSMSVSRQSSRSYAQLPTSDDEKSAHRHTIRFLPGAKSNIPIPLFGIWNKQYIGLAARADLNPDDLQQIVEYRRKDPQGFKELTEICKSKRADVDPDDVDGDSTLRL